MNLLKKHPLFKGITEEEIQDVLCLLQAKNKDYKKGAYLLTEGAPVKAIGIVLSGSIQIFQDDYYGNRTIISSMGKGNMFAEAFVCAGLAQMPVSVFAQSDVSVLWLPKAELLSPEKITPYHDIIMRNLLFIVSQKNLFLNKRLRYSSHKTTQEKLLAYLSDEAKRQGSNSFTIPFDRQGLADYLGVERSAMSAVISRLVKEDILETKKAHFIIKNYCE